MMNKSLREGGAKSSSNRIYGFRASLHQGGTSKHKKEPPETGGFES
jgi:hypothetical protein